MLKFRAGNAGDGELAYHRRRTGWWRSGGRGGPRGSARRQGERRAGGAEWRPGQQRSGAPFAAAAAAAEQRSGLVQGPLSPCGDEDCGQSAAAGRERSAQLHYMWVVVEECARASAGMNGVAWAQSLIRSPSSHLIPIPSPFAPSGPLAHRQHCPPLPFSTFSLSLSFAGSLSRNEIVLKIIIYFSVSTFWIVFKFTKINF